MEKLIVKGGFRERANRYKKFHQSENQQTRLDTHQYRKHSQEKEPFFDDPLAKNQNLKNK